MDEYERMMREIAEFAKTDAATPEEINRRMEAAYEVRDRARNKEAMPRGLVNNV